MFMNLKFQVFFFTASLILNFQAAAQTQAIQEIIDHEYGYLEELYKHLHAHPELSNREENTSERIADELRRIGLVVTENVGGFGVVGVLENGEGPVVMVRSDMDALPIMEETGVSFASTRTAVLASGEETGVMHACGHDMHMAVMVGTARALNKLRDQWSGTLIFIAQPAEETGSGARAMISDGLFERFPRPDYSLALHVNSALESGKAGVVSGYAYANVDNITILVKGRGGHSAYPDLTVDPIIIASGLVLNLQTIISREISALDSAVLSVGSFRGGHTANVIPNEVELRITLRTFRDEVREKIIRRIRDMSDAAGKAAGLPEGEWPEIELNENPNPSVYNDPPLAERVSRTLKNVLGKDNVVDISPVMYGEDFALYGRSSPDIQAVLYSLGSVKPADIALYEEGSIDAIPSTHSSRYLPDLEPTLRTGILTMGSTVLELMSSD
jgi:amidohydrolase